jgi:hypothetical protein
LASFSLKRHDRWLVMSIIQAAVAESFVRKVYGELSAHSAQIQKRRRSGRDGEFVCHAHIRR